MLGKLGQQVVEHADASVHLGFAFAFYGQLHFNAGLAGLAADSRLSLSHLFSYGARHFEMSFNPLHPPRLGSLWGYWGTPQTPAKGTPSLCTPFAEGEVIIFTFFKGGLQAVQNG